MNLPKCDELEEQAPAHDAYTCLLMRLPPDSERLWQEVEPLIERKTGVLVIDDTPLDKPYASKMAQAAFHALDAWQIEVYHRGLKQFTGIERAQYRLEVSQRNHIGLAIRAFVRLEVHRLRSGISWFEAKTGILRPAVRHYLAHPSFTLQPTA